MYVYIYIYIYMCVCVCVCVCVYILVHLVQDYDLPRADKEYWYALLFSVFNLVLVSNVY